MISSEHFSRDILDFLRLLYENEVKYLIIGGEAVVYYGFARLTGDIDLFYQRKNENIDKLYITLRQFWDEHIPGLENKNDLKDKDAVFQFGVPPNRLDLISGIESISFDDAWKHKTIESMQIDKKTIRIYFIGLEHLIKNKQRIGRPKDLEDLKYLKHLKANK